MREIGGEFWLDENSCVNRDFSVEYGESRFLLSGRTAIDYIIRDIKKEHNLTSIYLPSYCCSSMVTPFISNQINVSFYEVIAKQEGGIAYRIPHISENDALFIIKYFGYEQNYPKEIFDAKKKGCLIIEDKTHSIFSSIDYSLANYTFASLRKWMYVSGLSIATKLNSEFLMPIPNKDNPSYISFRDSATIFKKNYILKGIGDKQDFLDYYKSAEELLERDYSGYRADENALNILHKYNFNNMKKKRRENARVLLDGLKDIKEVNPIFRSLGSNDCPLFVPILVKNNKRDELHKHLISKEIYCPIHWPLFLDSGDLSNESLELYTSEISLVCDQRYDANDMKRILDEIRNFYKMNLGDRNVRI